MTPFTLLFLAATFLAGGPSVPPLKLVEFQSDLAPGVLVNVTTGARPFDPPDPTRPAVVLIHGLNPTPRIVRISEAQRLAEAVARRGGPPVNMLGWDWNGDTMVGLAPRANQEHAVHHGQMLAGALLAAGIPPERIHLIGHSSGAIVATAAARVRRDATGRPVAQVTLLDPATLYHDMVFQRLSVGTSARVVHHFWAPGPSGLSKPVGLAGVTDVRVDVGGGWRGVVDPLRSAHLNTASWYIGTAADPSSPGGYNASAFAAAGLP
jgi:pimeloyl-ACP methyl ester carboxylesterase